MTASQHSGQPFDGRGLAKVAERAAVHAAANHCGSTLAWPDQLAEPHLMATVVGSLAATAYGIARCARFTRDNWPQVALVSGMLRRAMIGLPTSDVDLVHLGANHHEWFAEEDLVACSLWEGCPPLSIKAVNSDQILAKHGRAATHDMVTGVSTPARPYLSIADSVAEFASTLDSCALVTEAQYAVIPTLSIWAVFPFGTADILARTSRPTSSQGDRAEIAAKRFLHRGLSDAGFRFEQTPPIRVDATYPVASFPLALLAMWAEQP